MSLKLSAIQMVGFQVIDIRFKSNDLHEEPSELNTISLEFKSSGLKRQDSGSSRLEALLTVRSVGSSPSQAPYDFLITVRGLFEATQSSDEETEERFYLFMRSNAYSLLYGSARSSIQQISSLTPVGTINLPCIDTQSIVSNLISPEE